MPSDKLSVEEIATMWEKVDKSKLVQYKLKVDLNADVQKIINDGPQAQESRTTEITNAVTGQIKDKMLIDSRDQKPEETKEKPRCSDSPSQVSTNQIILAEIEWKISKSRTQRLRLPTQESIMLRR